MCVLELHWYEFYSCFVQGKLVVLGSLLVEEK